MRLRRAILGRLRRLLLRLGIGITRLSEEDRCYLTQVYQPGGLVPPDAARELRHDHPDLVELRQRYATFEATIDRGRRWGGASVARHLDLQHFRGDSLYVWHYRDSRQLTRLKFYVYLQYLRARDPARLLERLTEDGAFGCWTFDFAGQPTVSRDLLDSINELYFLERHFGALTRPGLRVLDIGAGYGRLAHRFAQVAPVPVDYCCVDAVPESTFLSRHYLAYRQAIPPARVLPLDAVERELTPGRFDVALNVHSFSECPHAAIAWWVGQVRRLEIPYVMLVPNDGAKLLSAEADGSRRPFENLLADAGYELAHFEPTLNDDAVRELVGIPDMFLLYRSRVAGV